MSFSSVAASAAFQTLSGKRVGIVGFTDRASTIRQVVQANGSVADSFALGELESVRWLPGVALLVVALPQEPGAAAHCIDSRRGKTARDGAARIRRAGGAGMTRRLSTVLTVVGLLCGSAAAVRGQAEALLTDARSAASAGRRAEALAMIETRLAGEPQDVDARLLHAQILSWDGRYEEARRELHDVLAQAPAYTDARAALMHVEWWSGQTRRARELADSILAQEPGHAPARAIRDRSEAALRPWAAAVTYATDTFSDGRAAWHETSTSIGRRTSTTTLVVRASDARRFGGADRQVEIEAYPRFRPGTYASIALAGAVHHTFFPAYRGSLDVHQTVGRGYEVAVGFRRLLFDEPSHVYAAAVSKYAGRWLLTGRALRVVARGAAPEHAYQAGVRRYVGQDGASSFGVIYGHGMRHDEIRDAADLVALQSDAVRAEVNRVFGGRVSVLIGGGTSRQERRDEGAAWQTSLTTGLVVQF